jgi:hypothetical protein
MKRLQLIGSLVLAAALAAVPTAARAGSSGVVPARVVVMSPCLTIEFTRPGDTSIDFGVLGFGQRAGVGNSFQVDDCAPSGEVISGRATDATSATSNAKWSLVAGPLACPGGAPGEYALDTAVAGVTGGDVFLTTSDTVLGLAGAGSHSGDVTLWMPCFGSDGAGEAMTFQFVYTASV